MSRSRSRRRSWRPSLPQAPGPLPLWAGRAPSWSLWQDKETLAELSRLNAAVMGTQNDPFYGAPTAVLVLGEKNNPNGVQDASLVMGNLLLAASGIGLGSCWINRAKETFETPEGQALLAKWGLDPEKYIGVGYCILGYPAPNGTRHTRPPQGRLCPARMIFGVGIDLCDAGRLEKSLAKQSFLDHVFAPSEQALLASLGEKRRAETAAANFAAKEAFLKAAGHRSGRLCHARAGRTAPKERCALFCPDRRSRCLGQGAGPDRSCQPDP